MRHSLPIALALLASFSASSQPPSSQSTSQSAKDELRLPADYREWVFLSSGLGMTYTPVEGAGPANPPFQNVFVSPDSYRAFLKNGTWPDKTTFILEIRTSGSQASINRSGHFQTGIAAIEAEVKQGAVWTFYGFGKDGTTARPLPRTERCYTCHAENGAVDNTFVQFYPTLMPVARAKGTFKVTAESK